MVSGSLSFGVRLSAQISSCGPFMFGSNFQYCSIGDDSYDFIVALSPSELNLLKS